MNKLCKFVLPAILLATFWVTSKTPGNPFLSKLLQKYTRNDNDLESEEQDGPLPDEPTQKENTQILPKRTGEPSLVDGNTQTNDKNLQPTVSSSTNDDKSSKHGHHRISHLLHIVPSLLKLGSKSKEPPKPPVTPTSSGKELKQEEPQPPQGARLVWHSVSSQTSISSDSTPKVEGQVMERRPITRVHGVMDSRGDRDKFVQSEPQPTVLSSPKYQPTISDAPSLSDPPPRNPKPTTVSAVLQPQAPIKEVSTTDQGKPEQIILPPKPAPRTTIQSPQVAPEVKKIAPVINEEPKTDSRSTDLQSSVTTPVTERRRISRLDEVIDIRGETKTPPEIKEMSKPAPPIKEEAKPEPPRKESERPAQVQSQPTVLVQPSSQPTVPTPSQAPVTSGSKHVHFSQGSDSKPSTLRSHLAEENIKDRSSDGSKHVNFHQGSESKHSTLRDHPDDERNKERSSHDLSHDPHHQRSRRFGDVLDLREEAKTFNGETSRRTDVIRPTSQSVPSTTTQSQSTEPKPDPPIKEVENPQPETGKKWPSLGGMFNRTPKQEPAASPDGAKPAEKRSRWGIGGRSKEVDIRQPKVSRRAWTRKKKPETDT